MLETNRGKESSAAITIVLCLTLVGAAQPHWKEQDRLLASDGAAGDRFGCPVSISGDYAIVGAHSDSDNGEGSGSAYIFRRLGTVWTQQQKLLPSDGAAYDVFGCSVSITGDWAIVGAYGDDDNGDGSGSAYIFKQDGTAWTQQQKLLPSDGTAENEFGRSVSISGGYTIVGAYNDDDNGDGSGSAYIFTRDGTLWTQQQKLLASDGVPWDNFGWSVSISEDCAIVGAPKDDDNGTLTGSVYFFRWEGTAWTQQQKLLASDAAARDKFGYSVSINGDYAIVGAPWDKYNPRSSSGSAYIFKREGTAWTQQQKLLASDRAPRDEFGRSVSISGDYAIVGAPRKDDHGSYTGSAYIFTPYGTAWKQQQKLLASDGAAGDMFGLSVSISGDYAIVGALSGDGSGTYSGSPYIYQRVTCPVYRFWSPVNLRHFYTISKRERDKLLDRYSYVWTYEGVAYYAYSGWVEPDLVPVYRFWSGVLRAHFYTVWDSEKQKLIDMYQDAWAYEGIAFYAYPEERQPIDASPVYRFWSDTLSCHFYTISERERDKLIDNYSHVWTYEGIAWYAYE